MGLQGPQETSSPFPGPRPEWPVQRLLRALHRGRLTPSRGSTGRRRVATPKAGGLPRPQQADLVTGRAAGSASHALWPLGRGGTPGRATPSASRSPPVPPPRPPRSPSPPNRTPQHPSPTRVATTAGLTILSPGFRSVTTNAAALFLRHLADPPTSSTANETPSLRETVLRRPVRVLPRQKKKKKPVL